MCVINDPWLEIEPLQKIREDGIQNLHRTGYSDYPLSYGSGTPDNSGDIRALATVYRKVLTQEQKKKKITIGKMLSSF